MPHVAQNPPDGRLHAAGEPWLAPTFSQVCAGVRVEFVEADLIQNIATGNRVVRDCPE